MALLRKTRAAWMATIIVPVLVVTGCSTNDGAKDASDASEVSDASTGSSKSSGTPAKNGQLEIPADADEDTKKAYVMENTMAACMRKQGFEYTPFVPAWSAGSTPVDGQDYARAKKFRSKYGFGIYAAAVYPEDPALATEPDEANPNTPYIASLSSAQRKAYDRARGNAQADVVGGRKRVRMTGCEKEAYAKAYGPAKSQAEQEKEAQASQEKARAAMQALNGDPELVGLAQKFASCLRGEGIPVTTTQPTEISDMVKFSVSAQIPPQSDGVKGMDPSDARAELTKEIDLALKDLKCGKAFRAAYLPKLAKNPISGITG
ncbi:hypothetical protein ACIOWI_36015 [Streptomyces sp. NPDC087659]|uniref:hypothetical protein n=1 Tax=Streptomyces sp. NPDC087659 TaxID=3365801 RepID=UPI0037F6B455